MAYEQYRPNSFKVLPAVVKNLLIINVLFFLASYAVEKQYNIDLANYLGLHYFSSGLFKPYQLVTYMFMHGSIEHILFNMFALWMFGNVLENFWGPKRFLIFYMITGIGAALIQLLVAYIRLQSLYSQIPADELHYLLTNGTQIIQDGKNFINPIAAEANIIINGATIGASGAVFGILVGFGLLFPNTELFLMFIPIPIKAKYAVILYAVIELVSGVAQVEGDNIAHFAHLGGALFGFILVKYWQRNKKQIF